MSVEALPGSIAEARAQGSSRYFTGVPCKHGHVAWRATAGGSCSACWSAWREAHSERHRENQKAYEERRRNKNGPRCSTDPERAKERAKAWRAANPERAKEKVTAWNVANSERVRERQRAYYEANRERHREQQKIRRLANPELARVHNANRRAKKRGAEGCHTKADREWIFKAQKGKCAYCRVQLTGGNNHLDHIVSLVKGGTNWPSNLQWLCQQCNCRKQAADPIEFAQRLGMLL